MHFIVLYNLALRRVLQKSKPVATQKVREIVRASTVPYLLLYAAVSQVFHENTKLERSSLPSETYISFHQQCATLITMI